jgi:hypothetical protein
MQIGIAMEKDNVAGFTKLNLPLPYDPATTFPNVSKTFVYTKTGSQLFITALFINGQTQRQPRYSSVGEWINELWYIQSKKYYSAMKINGYQAMKTYRGNANAFY